MAAKCPEQEDRAVPTHNGIPIPPWTETAKSYLVVKRFPHLQKQKSFESGLDALTLRERLQLEGRADQVEIDLRQEQAVVGQASAELHSKVSLLAGGNLAYVAADAVVNAANTWLTTGKGVNGALHAAAGHRLLDECVQLGGCDLGQAKLTAGYDLPAKHIIHCVGPEGKTEDREVILRQCYLNCLELCKQHNLRTVAFCCISTGHYGYPSVEAADTALSTVREWLLTGDNFSMVDRIIFSTRTAKDEEAYSKLMTCYFPIQ